MQDKGKETLKASAIFGFFSIIIICLRKLCILYYNNFILFVFLGYEVWTTTTSIIHSTCTNSRLKSCCNFLKISLSSVPTKGEENNKERNKEHLKICKSCYLNLDGVDNKKLFVKLSWLKNQITLKGEIRCLEEGYACSESLNIL